MDKCPKRSEAKSKQKRKRAVPDVNVIVLSNSTKYLGPSDTFWSRSTKLAMSFENFIAKSVQFSVNSGLALLVN